MREKLDRERLGAVMRRLGAAAREPVRVDLAGGASAVLLGWRESTVDLAFRLEPDRERIRGSIPELRERLRVDLEPASSQDFPPELPGRRDRALCVRQEGRATILHDDLHAQALAKLERGHVQDTADVRARIERDLVEPERLRALFAAIEPALGTDPRWAAVDLPGLRRAVEEVSARRGADPAP
jgi:hypothetical protein